METLEATESRTGLSTSVSGIENKKLSILDRQAINFEKARFYWLAVMLTSQSCLASIACAFILKNQTGVLELCICAALAMGCNALFIAQASAKACIVSFYISVVVNAVFIITNV